GLPSTHLKLLQPERLIEELSPCVAAIPGCCGPVGPQSVQPVGTVSCPSMKELPPSFRLPRRVNAARTLIAGKLRRITLLVRWSACVLPEPAYPVETSKKVLVFKCVTCTVSAKPRDVC